jgi:endonuclease/exonuclease/phosphatase family metal-dependent hydrolase
MRPLSGVARVAIPLSARPRLIVAAVLAALALLALAAAAVAAAEPPPAKVMTRNIYVGASLTRASQATNQQEFLAAVSTIFTNFQATDFPARANALAREIEQANPALIGVQEVALWRRGPIGVLDGPATPATEVVLDFLPVLRAELAARGIPYDVVREQQELDLEAPAGAPYFRDIRLTSRDVILAKRGQVTVHDASSANFEAASMVPSPVGPFEIKASWVAADVTVNKRSFRFVTTHLEPFDPVVRADQAAELVAPGGPAASSEDPVVLVGDMNSDPADTGPHGAAFDVLAAAGLVDTWVQANGSAPGFTHGFGELLDDPDTSGFDTRIDHVLTRGAAAPASKAKLTGLDADNRTPSGLWPSDHAGVVTTLFP